MQATVFIFVICASCISRFAAIAASSNSFSYYDILGVPLGANDEEIKRAYRRAAVRLHPDKNLGDKEAEEQFKKLNEAYNVLKNKNQRMNYDSTLRARKQESFSSDQSTGRYGSTAGPGFTAAEPFFSNLYNRRRYEPMQRTQPVQFPQPPKWQILRVKVKCTLEELSKGCIKHPSSKYNHGNYCLTNVLEAIRVRFRSGAWERYIQAVKTGLWLDAAAQSLIIVLPSLLRMPLGVSIGIFSVAFNKFVPELPAQVYEVHIPPGSNARTEIRIGKDPEIIFEVYQRYHKVFERRGNDLLIRKKFNRRRIKNEDMTIKVPTLNQGIISVHLRKEEIYHGNIKAVNGLGMPINGSLMRGKLLIMILVV